MSRVHEIVTENIIAMLDAGVVHACDIDPQALIATRDNAQGNGVESRLHVHDDAASLPQGVDVVMANILAGTLVELAPRLCGLLRPGGQLVLAGILRQQVHEVRAGFAERLELSVFAERDGWSAMTGTLPASAGAQP